MTSVSNRSPWHEAFATYAQPRLGRGLLDIATSAAPYLALCVAMYLMLRRLAFACGCAGDPDGRVPGPGVRGVSRLRPRFAASVQSERTHGSARSSGCWCSRLFGAGATITSGTTPPQEISTAAA